MTVILDGASLTPQDVVAVARGGAHVALDPEARKRIEKARSLVEESRQGGRAVYGLTTGVGVQKRVGSGAEHEPPDFERRLLHEHSLGQGPALPADIVRATALRIANHFALGTVGVRAELADRLLDALNGDTLPSVPMIGEYLVLLPALALGVTEGFPLAPGEGLALLSNSALADGYAALALHDLATLCAALDAAAALSFEAFGGRLEHLHAGALRLRRDPGVLTSAANMRAYLAGSRLSDPAASRNLQDPLTFRDAPHLHGALYDAIGYATELLAGDLNSAQSNPVILAETGEIVHVGNFEAQALVSALDFVRLSAAPALTAAQERATKLLDSAWSGLPTGLVAGAGRGSGLAIYQHLVQPLAAEAMLLAQPVSFTVTTTTTAEGIEDRHLAGLLACRRLVDMVRLGEQLVAVELLVAAQAMELRAARPWGAGTSELLRRIRTRIPFTTENTPVPTDLTPLTNLIHSTTLLTDLPPHP